ncbi:hypothetical protein EDEG_00760 [Edhazardia aedis USNM 41457]|uniref:Uncharacterized protein n=1 Tax=Edhazardia aedis (strain USNM 41457) TaxID=1003232 RepID=J9DCD6_EDHAE|nr:hypothetical protein EDEG_00760 [Edhazardia aedis USNM 41457]|eukprot:EJW05149.1 hypothetical protein EDEG_00760 [Edhazardia aedis USNM 41457]
MSDTNATAEKAKVVKEETVKKAKDADKAIDNQFNKIDQSKLGEFLPTHVENISLKTIVYFTIFLSALTTIAIYLMIVAQNATKAKGEQKATFANLMCYLLLIVGICGIVYDMVVIMMRMMVFFKISLIIKLIKVINIFCIGFCLEISGIFTKGLLFIFLFGCFITDLLYIKYGYKYFSVNESNDGEQNTKEPEP